MNDQVLLVSKSDLNEILVESRKYERLETPTDSQPETTERHQFSKDYARILYSSSFRRLQGKMQFLSVVSSQFYRNRLTHSHEVVQIARSIASALRGSFKKEGINDFKLYGKGMNVLEAVCLAHDIGNPPFGHAGERVLNDLMKDQGGYEGNAQTFRIINKLERRFPNQHGLLLSKRTLCGVVKYFKKGENNKKFLYDEDYETVTEIASDSEVKIRTLDAQIMDLADEIAYAAHDLEDALKINVYTIDDLLYEFEKSEDYSSMYNVLNDMVISAKDFARQSNNPTSEDFHYFFSKELTSQIVNLLVRDIGFVVTSQADKEDTGTQNQKEFGYTQYGLLSLGLKKLNFKCLMNSNSIFLYEKQGERILKDLYELFMDESFDKKMMLLPPEYRILMESDGRSRVVCDYLSGMMDTFAIDLHKKYFGKNALNCIR